MDKYLGVMLLVALEAYALVQVWLATRRRSEKPRAPRVRAEVPSKGGQAPRQGTTPVPD